MTNNSDKESELKTQFTTREGTYKVYNLNDYQQQTARVPYGSSQPSQPVKVSFVTVADGADGGPSTERIAFNVGRELYFFNYRGLAGTDPNKLLDKKVYKGTVPTCHDFNQTTASAEGIGVLVGFSHGQVQLIDPIRKDVCKLYNEERLIEKTRVTGVHWLSQQLFVVSHSSGNLYIYNEEHLCGTTPPHYSAVKQGTGYTVYKSKPTRNPLYKWSIGEAGSVNQFEFSPCGQYLATVGQDGYLRVFHFDSMELVGVMKSYFGGLNCLAWSPDGALVATGGEDDLVTVWSFAEGCVVARGRGHRSWVTVVAFDPYVPDETPPRGRAANSSPSYRLASVGQDSNLCLWDVAEDVLRRPAARGRGQSLAAAAAAPPRSNSLPGHRTVGRTDSDPDSRLVNVQVMSKKSGDRTDKDVGLSVKYANISPSEKSSSLKLKPREDWSRVLGSSVCPYIEDVPLLEPLISKKISHERLSALIFRSDCFVTACHDGFIATWSRPRGLVNSGSPTGPGTVV